MNVTERINRILFIMSHVSQHQGIRLENLAKAVGMRQKQLERELDFMLLIGKPPFRPDDYVDIYVDDEERVWIDFDQMLNRPLRFTRPEAMALLLSLQLLDPEVGPEVMSSLKEKIEKAISNSVDPNARLEDRIVLEESSRPVSESFQILRQSIEENRKIALDYYALIRDETSRRIIRPYFLMKHLGYWYLNGYCEARKDMRTFKFERILEVDILDERFEAPEDFDLVKYKSNFLKQMGGHKIQIFFEKPVAPWIQEEWGSAAESSDDGVLLTFDSETLEFPSRLVLQHAPYARPVSPVELIEKVKEDSADLLRTYASETASIEV